MFEKMSQIESLLSYSSEEKRKIREYYNKTEEDVKQDLNTLVEWLDQQEHLPKPHNINIIESILVRNKFRIEQTKAKIDKYYTYKGLYPEVLSNYDPKCQVIEKARKSFIWVPLPKLLPSLERVLVLSFIDKKGSIYDIADEIPYILGNLEIRLCHDYAKADRFLIDLNGFTLTHLKNIRSSIFDTGMHVYHEGLSGKITAMDIINVPTCIDDLMKLYRRILPASYFTKIKIHFNIETLYDEVPREYLPMDYGGSLSSLYELHDKWGKEILHQRDFLLGCARNVCDENKRIGELNTLDKIN